MPDFSELEDQNACKRGIDMSLQHGTATNQGHNHARWYLGLTDGMQTLYAHVQFAVQVIYNPVLSTGDV